MQRFKASWRMKGGIRLGWGMYYRRMEGPKSYFHGHSTQQRYNGGVLSPQEVKLMCWTE